MIEYRKHGELGLATIIKYSKYQGKFIYIIEFSPGLPYDERTKGMPHRKAGLIPLTINNKKGKTITHLALCALDDKNVLDLTTIYKLSAPDIVFAECYDWLVTIGYKLVDAVKNEKKALIESAKLKLSEKEIQALGLNV